MAKRCDIKKILVIGSGPIVIGQAAEFDYAGTQACLALKEEGYEVILCNSNPATIMTDTSIADKVYMEPLTLEYVAKIIRHERPDAIVPGIGGQTGLNLAMLLEKKGILKECQVELLGTSSESIERAEDRELFKKLCEELGEPVLPSAIANTVEEAQRIAEEIGYPVVLRPAFTLGGTGGGFAENEQERIQSTSAGQVYLLSIDEIEKYFDVDASADFAKIPWQYNGKMRNAYGSYDSKWWWTRTSDGYHNQANCVKYISDTGYMSGGNDASWTGGGVRPAITISITE